MTQWFGNIVHEIIDKFMKHISLPIGHIIMAQCSDTTFIDFRCILMIATNLHSQGKLQGRRRWIISFKTISMISSLVFFLRLLIFSCATYSVKKSHRWQWLSITVRVEQKDK